LRLHRAATEAILEQNGVTPARDWVFVTSQGTPIHPDNVERTLKRLAKQAGIRSIRVHDLRHTYASLARRQGVSLEIVSQKLGHSRPSFTADVYRHTFEDEHEGATLELSELTSVHTGGQRRSRKVIPKK
jgi:integrase